MNWLEDISVYSNLDCGDSSCKYKKSTVAGMRTNGGCCCSSNHPRDVERFLIRNYYKACQQVLDVSNDLDKIPLTIQLQYKDRL